MSAASAVIRNAAIPLVSPVTGKADYSPLLKAIGGASIVMIGEASHGTHEFYFHRAEITKTLIEQKGFTFVATEADWPDAYRVNRYVQAGKNCKDETAEAALGDFKRFPLWMWRNKPVEDFVTWLRQHNDQQAKERKVAFYGLDLYSFYTSMDAVIEYLEKVSPEDAMRARERYSNFDRFQGEPSMYGFASGIGLSPAFENEVVQTLVDLQHKGEAYLQGVGGLIDGDELFYATQNAQLVANSERYYRSMYHANENSWNLRDQHMASCFESLLQFQSKKHSTPQKAVIWAHNSHLGDASATDAFKRGEINVGYLLRKKFPGTQTFNIGFSTNTGSVTCADSWDSSAIVKRVKPGLPNSYERLFHSAAEGWNDKFTMIFRSNTSDIIPNSQLVQTLAERRLERYIGVIYKPETERASHYSNSKITQEFDAAIFLDQTTAVEPIDPTTTWNPHVI